MAVTAGWYYNAFFSAFGGAGAQIDTEVDAMKVALLQGSGSYTLSQANHDYFDDVVGSEVSSSGYSAGGYALVSLDQAFTSNVWYWTAANPSWTGVTFTTRYAIYYDGTGGGTNATRPLMSFANFGADQSISAANFSLTHDAAGIVKVTITISS